VRCRGWCPWCYEGLKGRAVRPGHFGWSRRRFPSRAHDVATFRVPASAGVNGVPARRGWRDEVLAESHPALVGWVGDVLADDGTARDTGTILLFAEDGALKACLNDRQSGARCFLSAPGLDGLLNAIEETLATGKGDWRAPKEAPAGKGARRT